MTDTAEQDRAAVLRRLAVARAPALSDLRDAICFVERHDHLAETSYCHAGRAQAYRIREALIARYMYLGEDS